MNLKIIKLAVIFLITLASLRWLRANGVFDFDLRTIVPFTHGKVTIHDCAGVVLIGLGVWGFMRLQRQISRREENDSSHDSQQPRFPSYSDYPSSHGRADEEHGERW